MRDITDKILVRKQHNGSTTSDVDVCPVRGMVRFYINWDGYEHAIKYSPADAREMARRLKLCADLIDGGVYEG